MGEFRFKLKIYFSLLFIVPATPSTAHNRHHSQERQNSEAQFKETHIFEINELYKASVKSIFKEKCFDCHSHSTLYPWYYRIPGAKQLIDSDIKEAKTHLNFSNDFPFGGHGLPFEDIIAIQDVVKNNSMPPLRYRILHQGSSLSVEDRRVILDWVRQSKALLTEKNK